MAIRLAVYDLAGTTVYDDNGVNLAFRDTLDAHGIDIDPAWVNEVMGLRKIDALRTLLLRKGLTRTNDELQQMHDEFVSRMVNYYETSPDVREIPGASEVFRELRDKGIRIAVNTGFTRSITNTILKRLNWTIPEVIDASITSDEVPEGRPHPYMIEELRSRFGITDPKEVAKIGDTTSDLGEGINAGCGLVIGVTSGAYTRESLETHPHTHIVNSVRETPAIILHGG